MSVVWRAHDEVLRRPVAVKLLSSRYLADWASRQRIRSEAQAVAQLSHPNVAGVYDYGESEREDGERVPYVVMELLNGPSLAQLLSGGPLPAPRALSICAQVAAALAAAHERGIVHRDVKPANVMLTETGAKVVDFGVAAVIGDLSEHSADVVLYGTPAYLAPERLDGGPVVAGTDVYALALLVYRLLTGVLPWSVDTATQMLHAHLYVEPKPLPPLLGVPPSVAAICARALAKDPAARPAAAEVAKVLALAAGRPIAEASFPAAGPDGVDACPSEPLRAPVGFQPAGAVRSHNRPRLVMAGVVVALLAAVATAAVVRLPGGGAGATGLPPVGGTGPSAAASPAPSGSGATATAGTGSADPTRPAIVAGAPAPAGAPAGQTTTPPAVGPGPGPTVTVTSSATPAGVEETVTTDGGSLVVRCTDASAYLVSWVPAEGYKAKDFVQGPGTVVTVKFAPQKRLELLSTDVVKVRCVDGVPRRVNG